MALQKQTVYQMFDQGLMKHIDEKFIVPGGLISAENIGFDKAGTINKRQGSTSLDNSIIRHNSSIYEGKRIFEHDNKLVLIDGYSAYTYNSNTNNWKRISNKVGLATVDDTTIGVSSVVPGSVATTGTGTASSVLVGDHLYIAYVTKLGAMYYKVWDIVADRLVVSDTLLPSSGAGLKVVAIGTKVLFVFYYSNTISQFVIDVSDPFTLAGPTTITSTVHATATMFDVCSVIPAGDGYTGSDGYCFGVLSNNSANEPIRVTRWNWNLSTNDKADLSNTTTSPTGLLDITYSPEDNMLFSSYLTDDVSNVVTFGFNTELERIFDDVHGSQSITYDSNDAVIGGCIDKDGYYVAMYEDFQDPYYRIYGHRIGPAGHISENITGPLGVGLTTKPFLKDNKIHFHAVNRDSAQRHNFLINEDGYALCRYNHGRAQIYPPTIEPGVALQSGMVLAKPYNSNGDYVGSQFVETTISGTSTYVKDIFIHTLFKPNYNPEINITHTKDFSIINDKYFDGQNISEFGFHFYPPVPVVNTDYTGGGGMGPGTYKVKAVYVYHDSAGRTHRSAPSATLSYTVGGAVADDYFSVDVRGLSLSTKPLVYIEIYRTGANKDVYYLENSGAADDLTNTIEVGKSTFATISAQKQLYTTGGVLDNITPVLGQRMLVRNNRIFAHVGNNRIWYSKELVPNVGPEFNDTLYFDIDKDYGEVTALTKMGDSLIVFAERAIWAIYGDGLSATGSGAPFSPPRIISREIGCLINNEIGLTPEGCYFNSHRGIFLLTDNLGLNYIGEPIEDEITTVSRVLYFDDGVRLLSQGTDSWYTFQSGKWASATDITDLTDFTKIGSDFYWLGADGAVFVESAGFTKDDTEITMMMDTAWFRLSNFAGLQRIWKIQLLGEYKSPHTLNVSIFYDYSSTASKTITKYISSDPGTFLMELRPSRQKCTSISFRIWDSNQSGTGESFSLSGIAFEAGSKKGLFKSAGENRINE